LGSWCEWPSGKKVDETAKATKNQIRVDARATVQKRRRTPWGYRGRGSATGNLLMSGVRSDGMAGRQTDRDLISHQLEIDRMLF